MPEIAALPLSHTAEYARTHTQAFTAQTTNMCACALHFESIPTIGI